jgi:hypothetical protein
MNFLKIEEFTSHWKNAIVPSYQVRNGPRHASNACNIGFPILWISAKGGFTMQRTPNCWNSVSRTGLLVLLLGMTPIIGTRILLADEPIAPQAVPSESTEFVLVSFVRKTFTVENAKGRILLEGRLVSNRVRVENPQAVALIESFDSLDFKTDHEFFDWARKLRGSRTYTYDVVTTVGLNRIAKRVPLVLLPQKERELLDPLWRLWLEENQAVRELNRRVEETSDVDRARTDTDSSYAESLINTAKDASRSLSIISGETSLWEVELVEENSVFRANPFDPWGAAKTSVFVQAIGRTSGDASQRALSNNPGYTVGIVRKLSN